MQKTAVNETSYSFYTYVIAFITSTTAAITTMIITTTTIITIIIATITTILITTITTIIAMIIATTIWYELLTPVNRDDEHWAELHDLHMKELERVNGCYTECRWLLVLVVEFMEVLVQEGDVVDAVMPVREVVLEKWNL